MYIITGTFCVCVWKHQHYRVFMSVVFHPSPFRYYKADSHVTCTWYSLQLIGVIFYHTAKVLSVPFNSSVLHGRVWVMGWVGLGVIVAHNAIWRDEQIKCHCLGHDVVISKCLETNEYRTHLNVAWGSKPHPGASIMADYSATIDLLSK